MGSNVVKQTANKKSHNQSVMFKNKICVCMYILQQVVKGTGEILEEIVSKDRHKAINKVG